MEDNTETSLSIVGHAVSPWPTIDESSIFLYFLTLAVSLAVSKVPHINLSVPSSEYALAMHLSIQLLAFKIPLVSREGPSETT